MLAAIELQGSGGAVRRAKNAYANALNKAGDELSAQEVLNLNHSSTA